MKTFHIGNNPKRHLSLCGAGDQNLRFIEEKLNVEIFPKENELLIKGDEENVESALSFLNDLSEILDRKGNIRERDLITLANLLINSNHGMPGDIDNFESEFNFQTHSKYTIRAKNNSQNILWREINKNDIVFSIGPAGTGKTYMAVAIAVNELQQDKINKIILARPAVEAGENLGFLPGDFKDKIAPYLRPLYDALSDMLPREQLKRFLDDETIEVIPLAYMRGRTLNNGFVILDEAQNATITQMKMFLTRIGKNSKSIITGDITQIDLKDPDKSGLLHVQKVLKDVDGISFVYSDKKEVIRHKLVQDIIDAYENEDKE